MSKRAPSRRTLLGAGATMLLLAAPAAGAAKAEEIDGELLELCRDYQASYDRLMALGQEGKRLGRLHKDYTQEIVDQEERFGEEHAEWWDLYHEINATPARTPEGLRAKALALRTHMRPAFPENHYRSPYEQAALGLYDDILGRSA